MSPVAVTKMSPTGATFGHRHDSEAVHDGLESTQRVYFEHHHVGAVTLGPHSHAAPAPPVAGDDHDLAGDQAVGGADDAVQGGLPGAVAVVEHMLGHGLVDGDDGVLEHPVLLHGLEPDDPSGGLFGAADDPVEHVGTLAVQQTDHVGAVVHGQLRTKVDDLLDV